MMPLTDVVMRPEEMTLHEAKVWEATEYPPMVTVS